MPAVCPTVDHEVGIIIAFRDERDE